MKKFPLEALLILWRHSYTSYEEFKDGWVPRSRLFKLAQWLGPEFSWPDEAARFVAPKYLHYYYVWDSLAAHFKVPHNVLSYYAVKWSNQDAGNL